MPPCWCGVALPAERQEARQAAEQRLGGRERADRLRRVLED